MADEKPDYVVMQEEIVKILNDSFSRTFLPYFTTTESLVDLREKFVYLNAELYRFWTWNIQNDLCRDQETGISINPHVMVNFHQLVSARIDFLLIAKGSIRKSVDLYFEAAKSLHIPAVASGNERNDRGSLSEQYKFQTVFPVGVVDSMYDPNFENEDHRYLVPFYWLLTMGKPISMIDEFLSLKKAGG